MEVMGTNRPVKPVPLVFQDAINGVPTATDSNGADVELSSFRQCSAKTTSHSLENASKLKDQQTLSLQDNAELFLSSVSALAKRAAADLSNPLLVRQGRRRCSQTLSLHPPTCDPSSTRSTARHDSKSSRWPVTSSPPSLRPMLSFLAWHSTASFARSQQALAEDAHRFLGSWQCSYSASVPIGKPDPHCGVCQDMYVPIEVAAWSR